MSKSEVKMARILEICQLMKSSGGTAAAAAAADCDSTVQLIKYIDYAEIQCTQLAEGDDRCVCVCVCVRSASSQNFASVPVYFKRICCSKTQSSVTVHKCA
jgi:hypothetical protein